jgi:hypothetical protein
MKKAFAWILTAAALLVGADVFVLAADAAQPSSAKPGSSTVAGVAPVALHGGSGMPTPPPDAY